MRGRLKEPAFIVAFGVVLFVSLNNLSVVAGAVGWVVRVIMPLVIGLTLAFILNVPVSGLERLFNRLISFVRSKRAKKSGAGGRKRKPIITDRFITGASTIITLLALVLVFNLVIALAGPGIKESLASVYRLFQSKWPQIEATLRSYNIDIAWVADWFEKTDFRQLLEQLATGTGAVFETVLGAAASTLSGIITLCFALVIAVYVLFSKKELSRHCTLLMKAYCPKSLNDRVSHIASLARSIYAKFLSGQCVEAIILGVLIFIAFTVFRLPYAALVAVITAVSAFIPYIGAFAACALGAFLTLMADPSKVLLCIIVYQVVQFIENQFIYPHVVGGSVGLSPLLTLVAAIVGGKLLGLVGIIFFIPLPALIYPLIKQSAKRRLEQRYPDEPLESFDETR